MPIYAYKCEACGHAQDILRKMSDPALTMCPSCGKDALAKQVTAAGFQLKGSGWYVTDFRGGDTAKAADAADKASPATTKDAAAAPGASATPAPAAATPAPAPTASPAPSAAAGT